MDNSQHLETLYQSACEYRFSDFSETFSLLASSHPDETVLDACLMRAQIKLYACDETLIDDLRAASECDSMPRFPCLGRQWTPDSPNRFAVFSKAPGALRRFLDLLPWAGEQLGRWYGEAGLGMVRQIQSEILYFFGDFEGASALAEALLATLRQSRMGVVLPHYVLFRCYLATDEPEKAQQSMLDMVRTAKTHPECTKPYEVVRAWANLTTGWSGDSPRYKQVSHREVAPVLEDRLAAIQDGISQLSPHEEAFAAYAADSYENACTIRQHYMDVFHAIQCFQTGEFSQIEPVFMRAYQVAADSKLVMPFAEYGRQVIPLLQYVRDSGIPCPKEWVDQVLVLASRYEVGLNAYRA